MLERELYNKYKIFPEEIMNIDENYIIFAEGEGYLIRPLYSSQQRLNEQLLMGEWLTEQGDKEVATVLNSGGKASTIRDNGISYVVLHLPKPKVTQGSVPLNQSLGQRLALFHQLGYNYTPADKNITKQLLPWKERWERRLDQLEQWYLSVSKDESKNEFDKDFCLSFPYFLGISENSIQILADMTIDHFSYQGFNKTICHIRFKESTWLTIWEGFISQVKVTTDFTYDHFTRDISEYIRNIWDSQDSIEERIKTIENFLNGYEKIHQLTLIDQKLLIARLLFPLHYFESAERYYQLEEGAEKNMLRKQCLRLFKGMDDYPALFDYLLQRYRQLKTLGKLPQWLIDS